MCNLRFEIVNKKVDIRLAGVFINYVYSIHGTLIVYILFNNKTALSFVVSIMCHDCYSLWHTDHVSLLAFRPLGVGYVPRRKSQVCRAHFCQLEFCTADKKITLLEGL